MPEDDLGSRRRERGPGERVRRDPPGSPAVLVPDRGVPPSPRCSSPTPPWTPVGRAGNCVPVGP
ncbi:hypothetical protein QJS66_00775 [Kocuria rhizophila]|nr:hypothetical protein QJS66_00775 [Kocuria rhizophila]